uniref:Uncharacterized protein n=1 Tax=Picea glauca TaxID=3330 RepID=A0A117NFI5_PICGL|nr:hypothetical protein ABT39_MTgene3502 [Picea glauca]
MRTACWVIWGGSGRFDPKSQPSKRAFEESKVGVSGFRGIWIHPSGLNNYNLALGNSIHFRISVPLRAWAPESESKEVLKLARSRKVSSGNERLERGDQYEGDS